ncbi:MAG: DUF503 domain-containing protein [Firmicutes bacterium]|nr:DUF503 domain-containing protein [Bacillota bacterium]
MHILLLTVHLRLPGVRSLKEKRSIIRPLLHKLHRHNNLSVHEAADHDNHNRAKLAFSWVGPDSDSGRQLMENVVNHIETQAVQILDYTVEEL